MNSDESDNSEIGGYFIGQLDTEPESKIISKENEPIDVPNYELTQLLGKGHFGQVWKAIRLSDNKTIALKIIYTNSSNVEDVIRELEILKRISHPKCDPFLACFNSYVKIGSMFAIDMDLVVGKNLEVFINSTSGDKKNRYSLLIMKDIIKALKHLHRNGIIHNDVKPDNILITEDLTPVLVDFGVSCFNLELCEINSQKIKCCTGVKGPNLYISPETLKTKAYYPQSDIWSLGVTFYYVATGEYPFTHHASNVQELYNNILNETFRKLNTNNKTLNNIVNLALDKNPLTRITLKEISKMLDEL